MGGGRELGHTQWYSEITLGGPYVVSGIQLTLSTGKASAILPILSLWPCTYFIPLILSPTFFLMHLLNHNPTFAKGMKRSKLHQTNMLRDLGLIPPLF